MQAAVPSRTKDNHGFTQHDYEHLVSLAATKWAEDFAADTRTVMRIGDAIFFRGAAKGVARTFIAPIETNREGSIRLLTVLKVADERTAARWDQDGTPISGCSKIIGREKLQDAPFLNTAPDGEEALASRQRRLDILVGRWVSHRNHEEPKTADQVEELARMKVESLVLQLRSALSDVERELAAVGIRPEWQPHLDELREKAGDVLGNVSYADPTPVLWTHKMDGSRVC